MIFIFFVLIFTYKQIMYRLNQQINLLIKLIEMKELIKN